MSQITSLVISQTIPVTGILSFPQNIHVPFKPDLIKISNAYYEVKDPENAPDTAIHKIRSDLAGGIDGVLVHMLDRVQLSEPMLFSNEKAVSGTYTFDIDNNGLNEGIFMMTITFIKN
jgi:hypothetical protein